MGFVIPAVPFILDALTVGVEALKLRNANLRKQRLILGRSAHKMPFHQNRGSLVTQLQIGSTSQVQSQNQGKWVRDSLGEVILFALDPSTGSLVELPPGSFRHRRSLEKRGVNVFVQDAVTAMIVDYKPRRRRINPLNFKALMRANRRVDAFEKVIKKNFSVGAARKKRIKRKKRRK